MISLTLRHHLPQPPCRAALDNCIIFAEMEVCFIYANAPDNEIRRMPTATNPPDSLPYRRFSILILFP